MPLASHALEPLLRLALTPGVGPLRLARLIERFGSAERALGASLHELRRIPGFGGGLAAEIRASAGERGARRLSSGLSELERAAAVALTPEDLAYPPSFRDLYDPPYLLFAAGDLDLLDRPAIAVVGTRTPTAYGRSATISLSKEVVEAGYVVVSGMARGIDTAAHEAALDAAGATIGILGHGIDRVYPPENRPLFERTRSEGLLLSEFPPGEKPRAGNFPRRNRLISALSRGVVVVEMGLQSGAQHTVSFALEQGREVFAVPGRIDSAASEGTNQLIKDGARLITCGRDLVEELSGVGWCGGPAGSSPARRTRTAHPADRPQEELELRVELEPIEARLFAELGPETRHVDDLSASVAGPPAGVLCTLLGLEMKGLVEALPGQWYRRA